MIKRKAEEKTYKILRRDSFTSGFKAIETITCTEKKASAILRKLRKKHDSDNPWAKTRFPEFRYTTINVGGC